MADLVRRPAPHLFICDEMGLMKTASVISTGLVLGIAITFLASVATVAISAFTGASAAIPSVFSATVGEENGLPSVEFIPSGVGLLVVVGLVTIAYTIVQLRVTSRP